LILVLEGRIKYKKDSKLIAEKYGAIGGTDVYDLSSTKCPDDMIVSSEKCTIGIIK
jgi:hypothetical protein